MLSSLGFALPWILLALALLPVIYFLLRVTPPRPQDILFPAVRILATLVQREESAARTPPWLLLLRLAVAALIILGLAGPFLQPGQTFRLDGPVVVVIDNGWGAAQDWPARQRYLDDIIVRAERLDREVLLLPTTGVDGATGPASATFIPARAARRAAQALQPWPWPGDREATVARLDPETLPPSVNVVWLSDGIADASAPEIERKLAALGHLEVAVPAVGDLPRLLERPDAPGAAIVAENAGRQGLRFQARRAAVGAEEPVTLRAIAGDGALLGRATGTFTPEARTAEVFVDLPTPLRNRLARVEISGENTAGAVQLSDESWRRHGVGLVSTASLDNTQPLLSEVFYLDRAFAPFSDVSRGRPQALIDAGTGLLVLPDGTDLSPEEKSSVSTWLEDGGVLLRFAGPHLAQEPDDLLPVVLRGGDRVLGGALSWETPAPLAPFADSSPFFGLDVPQDVTIARQVLAEPALDLNEKTWARLRDGTPLVTAERRESGWLILVHTTANTDWSNLAISGLFVEMLERIGRLAAGSPVQRSQEPLPPLRSLDAFGQLTDPQPTALAIAPEEMTDLVLGATHPPGLYGDATARVSVNLAQHLGDTLATPGGSFIPVTPEQADLVSEGFAPAREVSLAPYLLAAALALLLADIVIGLWIRGLLRTSPRARPSVEPQPSGRSLRLGGLLLAASAAAFLALVAGNVDAQTVKRSDDGDTQAMDAALAVRLAYVRTGDEELDDLSAAGLVGLTEILIARTAVEASEPHAIDIEDDDLAFYPLIYWPLGANQALPTPDTAAKINAYLRNGGTILFDTGAEGRGGFGTDPGTQSLRALATRVEIPPLQPIPAEHVLTKAFYLMQEFPGRYAGENLWVEVPDGRDNDGVASVIVGGNDWAGAWAVDPANRPLHAVVPGGERQREWAYRFGVNLVMYALTGNYKADQVHVPAILERLGQ